jgi:hypothetical protein
MSSKPTVTTHSMRRTSPRLFPGYQSCTSSQNALHGAPPYATKPGSRLGTYAGRCIRSEWTPSVHDMSVLTALATSRM